MVSVNLHFNEADAAAFRAQMNRMIDNLGKAPEEAVRAGAVALISALRTRTRKAPQRRRVTASRSAAKGGRTAGGRQIYKAQSWRGGQKKTFSIFADSLESAKRAPAAYIHYAGLAKQSWGWTMQRLFPTQRVGSARFAEPRDIIRTSKRGKGGDFEIEIENKLDYIMSAFRTSGRMAVSGAMAAASGTMKGRIDKRLKGALR
jgi:hypothetical protein